MENNNFTPEIPEEENKVSENLRNELTQNVSFDVSDGVAVVSSAPENKNAKIPIIIAACVLAVAIIVSCIAFFVKKENPKVPSGDEASTSDEEPTASRDDAWLNELMTEEFTDEDGNVLDREEVIADIKDKVDEATTKFTHQVGITSPHSIVEQTTQAGGNNTDTEEPKINQEDYDKTLKQVEAFFNRSCYIQGKTYDGKTGEPLAMSLDGENFDMFTNLDGTEVAIMKLDGTLYFKRPATMQYTELTPSVTEMLGLDPNELNFSFGDADYESLKKNLSEPKSVIINGEQGICLEFKNSNNVFRFYSLGGNLKQIDTCDASGNVDMQICIDYFSSSIPGDQLTLKGYTKTSIGAIFADLF